MTIPFWPSLSFSVMYRVLQITAVLSIVFLPMMIVLKRRDEQYHRVPPVLQTGQSRQTMENVFTLWTLTNSSNFFNTYRPQGKMMFLEASVWSQRWRGLMLLPGSGPQGVCLGGWAYREVCLLRGLPTGGGGVSSSRMHTAHICGLGVVPSRPLGTIPPPHCNQTLPQTRPPGIRYPCEQIDRHVWKHYHPATSFCGWYLDLSKTSEKMFILCFILPFCILIDQFNVPERRKCDKRKRYDLFQNVSTYAAGIPKLLHQTWETTMIPIQVKLINCHTKPGRLSL